MHAYSLLPPKTILAHQGLALTTPANSIEAFAAAIQAGANVIETDAQATSDGVAVLFHDAQHNGTRIRDYAFSELPEYIPTLDHSLRKFPNVCFNIDIKTKEAIEPVVSVINQNEAQDRVLVTSFSARRRKKAAQLLPDVALSPALSEMAQVLILANLGLRHRAIDVLSRFDAVQIPDRAYGINLLTPRMMKIYKEARLSVHVWTINDPEHMESLWTNGVDGIVTDRTDLADQVRIVIEKVDP